MQEKPETPSNSHSCQNSFHSLLDGNALEGGQKWFAGCKSILLKRYYPSKVFHVPKGVRGFPF